MTLPVGTLVDWPGSLPAPRPPLIKRMFCWRLPDGDPCNTVLGWVVCIAENAGEISHGICPECASRFKGSPIPAVSGANESGAPTCRGAVLPGPTENAPGEQVSLKNRKGNQL